MAAQTPQEVLYERENLLNDPKIDIVMVSFNRKSYTESCIIEIHKRTTHPYRLIVVDNGSDDGSRDVILRWYRSGLVHVPILLDRNLGLERAKNIGLSCVNSRLYVDTDNDLIPSPGWLGKLIALMDKHQEYGAIACRPQVLIGLPGGIFNVDSDVVDTGICGAHLRVMRTDLVRSIGGWRNNFTNRSEEHWICSKIKARGYRCGYARDVRCIHLFGENHGYPERVNHYHREIWPPPHHFEWDRMNIDWNTCKPKEA